MWEPAGELREADVFWLGLRKLSLPISLHSIPHTARNTHPMGLGGEESPSTVDKMSKSADQEPGKKWR